MYIVRMDYFKELSSIITLRIGRIYLTTTQSNPFGGLSISIQDNIPRMETIRRFSCYMIGFRFRFHYFKLGFDTINIESLREIIGLDYIYVLSIHANLYLVIWLLTMRPAECLPWLYQNEHSISILIAFFAYPLVWKYLKNFFQRWFVRN